MDYKEQIILLLDHVPVDRLRRIYYCVLALIG